MIEYIFRNDYVSNPLTLEEWFITLFVMAFFYLFLRLERKPKHE